MAATSGPMSGPQPYAVPEDWIGPHLSLSSPCGKASRIPCWALDWAVVFCVLCALASGLPELSYHTSFFQRWVPCRFPLQLHQQPACVWERGLRGARDAHMAEWLLLACPSLDLQLLVQLCAVSIAMTGPPASNSPRRSWLHSAEQKRLRVECQCIANAWTDLIGNVKTGAHTFGSRSIAPITSFWQADHTVQHRWELLVACSAGSGTVLFSLTTYPIQTGKWTLCPVCHPR